MIITVPAKELARNKVSLGLTSLPVTAYAENGVTPLGRGQVHTVNVEVDQTTGTIKLKAEFNNEQYKLWPGDFVDCKIVVEQRDNGLTVPTAAIRHGPRGDFVWVIQPDNTVAIRPVRVRQTVGGTAVIDTGLDANEKIVLDGYARLAQGSRVEIVPPRSRTTAEYLTGRMNVSAPFIHRPIATTLLVVAIILMGLLGYRFLSVAALPTVEFPTIQVVTSWPGAAPDIVQSAISAPLESGFGRIPGLTSMTSTSSYGTSEITLQFKLTRPIAAAARTCRPRSTPRRAGCR